MASATFLNQKGAIPGTANAERGGAGGAQLHYLMLTVPSDTNRSHPHF